MTRNNLSELVARDLEIERTAFQNLRARIKQRVEELKLKLKVDQPKAIAKPQRTISEYVRSFLIGIGSNIVGLHVATNNFEIKLNIIQMESYSSIVVRWGSECPYQDFLEVYDTFKINGATNDTIKMRLFPFSLRNQAK